MPPSPWPAVGRQGDLLLRLDAAADAEARFLLALATARQQGALALERRGATALARLWMRQGRANDARGLLGPVYGRFTEGHAATDLLAAEALLWQPRSMPADAAETAGQKRQPGVKCRG